MDSMAQSEVSGGSSPWRRLLDWLDWKVNPVLLRDLRLYTKGKLILAAYFLTLAALVLLAVLYTLIARFEKDDGQALLGILVILLCVICGSMIPNLVFERFRAELANRATELALMSPLSPARLVRGKLLGAWCVSLIVLSTAAPMLATTYLLGGVNLLSIVATMGGVLVAALAMPTPQLFMATQRRGKGISRGIAGVVFGIQLVLMISYGVYLNNTFVETSYMPEFNYAIMIALVVTGVLVAQFLYFATVGRLQAEAVNRDAAPRLSLMLAAYVGGALAVALMLCIEHYTGRGPDAEEVAGLAACYVSYAFCAGFLVISYSSPVPPRGLREAWSGKFFRRILLLPGVKSLTTFFVVNFLLILAAALYGCWDFDNDFVWRVLGATLSPFMAVAYGLLAYYYVVLRLVKDKRNPSLLPVTIILTNLAIAIVSIFAMILWANAVGRDEIYGLLLASNPIGLLVGVGETLRRASFIGFFGLCCMGVLLLFVLPMLFGRPEKVINRIGKVDDAPR